MLCQQRRRMAEEGMVRRRLELRACAPRVPGQRVPSGCSQCRAPPTACQGVRERECYLRVTAHAANTMHAQGGV